jgi:hypothetical protein
MAATSITLVLSNPNIDPELISSGLVFRTTAPRGWELHPADVRFPTVKTLLLQWISLLKKMQLELKSLSTEYLGYLDICVYEDNFYVEDELLYT